MPLTSVYLYQDADGTVPLLDWLDAQPIKVVAKCQERLKRLALLGHELRRPECDFLRDGIYELRVGFRGQNYRMLYFYYGRCAVIVTHGLAKVREVPHREIELARRRKSAFEADPEKHAHTGDDRASQTQDE